MKSAVLRAPLLLAVLPVLLPGAALAQYKVVGPDGSVTYTDRPPVTSNVKVTPMSRRDGAGAAAASPSSSDAALQSLPADLRGVAARYPVLLYTTSDCPACEGGRKLLQQRGVPYVEKQVLTEPDAAALEKAVGWRTVPSVTIGAQALRGLNTLEWAAYLDAAGYPKESRLPRGWQPPAATPLVERARAPAPVAQAAPPPPPPPPPPPEPVDGDRPNIRF